MKNDSLRPDRLDNLIGQKDLTNRLKIAILSAMERNAPLEHILLYGPPGLGKTTIASLIAYEMSVSFVSTAAPVLKDIKSLSSIILNLKPNSVLFIDEIHRLPIALEEAFYSAIEDFKFPIMSGGSVMMMNLPKFTFVGATTRPDLLSAPMRSRFTIKESLEFYTEEELLQVIKRTSEILRIKMEEDGMKEIAKRSRGTPRIANNLLKRIRDFGIALKEETMKTETVINALTSLKIDPMGLDEDDKKYLYALAIGFKGGPVGLTTLASTLSQPEDVLIEIIEPYLLRKGLISITAKGRQIRQAEKETT